MNFKPGMIITDDEELYEYRPAASWCNKHNCHLEEIEAKEGVRQFQIVENPKPAIEGVRQQKYKENDTKCEEARVSQATSVKINKKTTLHFLTDRGTQQDLQTALASVQFEIEYPWVDEDGCRYTFTKVEEVAQCLKAIMLMAGSVYDKWAEYKDQIDKAQTLEELQSIHIDYTLDGE